MLKHCGTLVSSAPYLFIAQTEQHNYSLIKSLLEVEPAATGTPAATTTFERPVLPPDLPLAPASLEGCAAYEMYSVPPLWISPEVYNSCGVIASLYGFKTPSSSSPSYSIAPDISRHLARPRQVSGVPGLTFGGGNGHV